jgi:hypothetical protein
MAHTRKEALFTWLTEQGAKIAQSDITEWGYDYTFRAGDAEYRVLTNREANKACAEYIKQSLWAFNPGFLTLMTGFDSIIFEALAEKYEKANDAILTLIKRSCGFDEFVKAAVSADGRGHFLATYDGEENYCDGYYIYRV